MAVDERITNFMLKQKSGEFDVESIYSLNLQEQDISDLGSIGECTALETLNLSRNRVDKLYALSSLLNLAWLDLSGNMIQHVDGLQTMDKLKYLNLAGNLIQNVESLSCLFGLENLERLRLHDPVQGISNPVCASCTYKSDVMYNLPKLAELDGERLVGKGSDLFKLLNSLSPDQKGGKGGVSSGVGGASPLTDISADYFTLKEVEPYDHAAEQEFKDLLDECKELCSAANRRNQSET